MSDRDKRLHAADDEERDGRRRTPPREETRRTTVEVTSPIWRVISVALAAGSITAIGYYLQEVGYADAFGTVAAVAVVFTVKFWASKRPDQVALRFGPFRKIADAVRESMDDINAWVLSRPLRVGFCLAVGYGIALVALKSLIVALLAALYSWPLAVALGCGVGALVAAPEFVASFIRSLSLPQDSGDPQGDPGREPEGPPEDENVPGRMEEARISSRAGEPGEGE